MEEKIRLNLIIPLSLMAALKQYKKDTGVPVSEFVRRAVEKALAGHNGV